MRGSPDVRALNKFKVPQKTWGSWTIVARHVFNKTYETMIKSPEMFLHTEIAGQGVDDKHWKVTAWNAAWTAASIVSRGERHLLKDLTTRFKG